jgi:hypothetical protein
MLPINVTDISNNLLKLMCGGQTWSPVALTPAKKTTLCYLCQRQHFFCRWNKSGLMSVCSTPFVAPLGKFCNVKLFVAGVP